MTPTAAKGYNGANIIGERASRLKKRDILVIGGVALLALGVLLLWPQLAPKAPAGERCYVLLTVNGERQPLLPLDGERDIAVRQPTGETNVLRLTESGVRMHSSTCHNQLCVQQGEVTLENRDIRPLQNFIVCLPNRVSVELLTAQEAAALEEKHE